mmetsp:Transcript_48257/g.56416  ORF Transcript_48257/g.56416 Transcript_48257/m.56416 type:complete len:87 (+) Transcript_48257:43-303(+)
MNFTNPRTPFNQNTTTHLLLCMQKCRYLMDDSTMYVLHVTCTSTVAFNTSIIGRKKIVSISLIRNTLLLLEKNTDDLLLSTKKVPM